MRSAWSDDFIANADFEWPDTFSDACVITCNPVTRLRLRVHWLISDRMRVMRAFLYLEASFQLSKEDTA